MVFFFVFSLLECYLMLNLLVDVSHQFIGILGH